MTNQTNFDRVLMIGWEYPPHNSGGLGVACQGLTEALADANTQIYFTLPYQHPLAASHMDLITCAVEGENTTFTGAPFSVYSPLRPILKKSRIAVDELTTLPQSELEHRVSSYAQEVASQAKKLRKDFEVIHAHDWMSLPAAFQAQAKTGKPVVAHVHSTEYDRIPSGLGSPYIMETEAMGLKKADRVIAVSYYTKHVLVSKYGLDPDKIDVVHNGIQPWTQKPKRDFAVDQPVVVFMGRLTQQKGAEFFLDVARQVKQQVPDALFIVAGNGDQYYDLLFKTAYDEMSASVLFSGFVRDKQRERLLDRADVFLMPSLSEPFGLVALEAAQRHTPVIISKNSGVAEVLPSAIAIDFWDVDQMSRQLVQLLQSTNRRQKQVTAQLSDVKKITWQNAAQQVKDSYRRAFTG
jgi:glycogen synthase